MIRRPKWHTLTIVCLLVCLTFGVACYLICLSSPNRITEENANRIQPGMRLEEVEQILGPERDDTYGEAVVFHPPSIGLVLTKNGPLYQRKHWIGREIVITVEMNSRTATVHSVWTSEPLPVDLSAWERIQNRVKALLNR